MDKPLINLPLNPHVVFSQNTREEQEQVEPCNHKQWPLQLQVQP